eukprot:scaffold65039_cov45-Tisochrysis_lutea.AAC.2
MDEQHVLFVGRQQNASRTLDRGGVFRHHVRKVLPISRPTVVDELGWLERTVCLGLHRLGTVGDLVNCLHVARPTVVVELETVALEPREVDGLECELRDAQPDGLRYPTLVGHVPLLPDGTVSARLEGLPQRAPWHLVHATCAQPDGVERATLDDNTVDDCEVAGRRPLGLEL